MIDLIFDSDLVGDDLLTLVAMKAFPSVRLGAITVYGRRIGGLRRAAIAKSLIDRLGFRGVEILPGADAPLLRAPVAGCTYCDRVIDAFVASEVPSDEARSSTNTIARGIAAAEYLVRRTREAPGQITLLCTGPLTNLALAYQLDPEITGRFERIVVMGGADKVSGNISPSAEANFFNDAEAAALVFSRFGNITMVGLDVTLKTAMTGADVADFLEGAMYDFVRDLVGSCCEAHADKGGPAVMPLHDVLAFYATVDPAIIQTESCRIFVETRSYLCYGMSVCDRKGPDLPHRVAVSVDTEKVRSMFMRSMAGL